LHENSDPWWRDDAEDYVNGVRGTTILCNPRRMDGAFLFSSFWIQEHGLAPALLILTSDLCQNSRVQSFPGFESVHEVIIFWRQIIQMEVTCSASLKAFLLSADGTIEEDPPRVEAEDLAQLFPPDDQVNWDAVSLPGDEEPLPVGLIWDLENIDIALDSDSDDDDDNDHVPDGT
jgi:hypothetical protein